MRCRGVRRRTLTANPDVEPSGPKITFSCLYMGLVTHTCVPCNLPVPSCLPPSGPSPDNSQETCGKSAALVERMRREDSSGAHLSISQRLHRKAHEQRRRKETLQMRVQTAIRRRANPHLRTRSRSLPRRSCGDAAYRLYEQAILVREAALERERQAQKPPGATFHPEIAQRSGVLAQRRRDRWVSLGVDVPTRGGASTVQELLLAEGSLYNRRREERQSRQEQLALQRPNPTVNEHSRRLLRNAERMGRSIGMQAGYQSGVSQVSQETENNFTPRLEALHTSKRMLESR